MKHTKKALLSSALSMLLCVSMLIGSTFAWFTDSVTSGRNQIVAGNLDIELEYATADDAKDGIDEGDWKPVNPDESLFNDGALWEPGHTEYVYLRVRNAGSLALKYNVSLSVFGDEDKGAEKTYTAKATDETGKNKTFKLSDYLVINKLEKTNKVGDRSELWLTAEEEAASMGKLDAMNYTIEEPLISGASEAFTLAVYMPTSVGNEANWAGKTVAPEEDEPTIFLGLNVNATQVPYESDSFGNDYDEGAELPKTEPDAPVVLVPKTTWSNKNNLQTVIYNAIKDAGKSGSATGVQSIVFSNWEAYKDEVGGSYEDGMIFGAVPEDDPESSDETGARVFYNGDTKAVYFLTESENAKIKAPTSMVEMFRAYQQLTDIDLSGLDTSEVTDFTRMFQYDYALTDFDLSSLDVSSATTFYAMFSSCKALKSVNMDGWDTSNLTSVNSMFSYCNQLESVDLSMLDFSHVTDLGDLFEKCTSLTEVNFGEADLSAVTSISGMFSGCTSLKSYDLTPFASSKLESIGNLFNGCTGLTEMDLSMLDTSELTSIAFLFQGCTNLSEINFGADFSTEKVTSMSYAFDGCSSLVTIDISTFNPAAADPANGGGGTGCMFRNCTKLKTIYASEKFVIKSAAGYYTCTDMFKNCTNLVGGNGTRYESRYYVNNQFQDFDRAIIDGLGGQKGYFTNISEKA